MVVAFAAPLTAMASNLSLSLGLGVGVGTLGWILIVGLLLAAFTAGYAVMARTVVSAGAYFAYIGHGLGRKAGAAAAMAAFVSYNLASAAMVAAAGYFAQNTVSSLIDLDIAWPLYSTAALAIMVTVSYIGIGIASKLTMIVSLLQFILLAVLTLKVFTDRPQGFTLEGFEPDALHGPGLSLTVVFLLLAFGGYEAAAAYGEECSAPERKIKQATFLGLGLLLFIFLISTWTLIAAFDDVRSIASADPASLLSLATAQHLGAAMSNLVTMTVAVSFLAAAVAIHNMAARYGFALGRAGLLPHRLAQIHPRHGTPHVAIGVQIFTTILVLAPFVILGADPIVNLFPIVSGVTALAMVGLLAACSLSVIVASFRGTVTGTVASTRILPTIALMGFLIVGGLIIFRYKEVTGSDSHLIAATPLVLVIGALIGVAATRRVSGTLSVK